MIKKTERLAWITLVVSLIGCVSLAIGAPLGVRYGIHHATRPLRIQLQPWQGTVTLQTSRQSPPVLLTDATDVLAGSRIGLEPNAEALLLFYLPEQPETPVMSAQLYGKTDLNIIAARMPRFASSPLPYRVALDIAHGANAQITIHTDEHSALLEAATPHGALELPGGIYVLSVTSERTEVAIRAGQARLYATTADDALTLTRGQHTTLTANGIGPITLGERDLMRTRNGDFSQPLDSDGWTRYATAALAQEDAGNVRQITGERPRLIFERFGQGHAETGIRQELAQNIRGSTSLQVRAQLRIDLQTLPGCGSLGTECPLMLRIHYTDVQGSSREWLQGFYAQEDSSTDTPFCIICEWKANHIRVPLNVWYYYESPNLIPLLEAQDIQPAVINAIDIYASGHAYSSQIEEIAILIGE